MSFDMYTADDDSVRDDKEIEKVLDEFLIANRMHQIAEKNFSNLTISYLASYFSHNS